MFLIWAILILVAAIQIPRMIKKKQFNTLKVYIPLWLFAGIYASLVVAGAPIPNVTDIILVIQEFIITNVLEPFGFNFLS
ncbi:hypothetical protein [Natranaerobius thermophilus]|uniref:Uncharacterized protein n=1 Tax=Natranaerobius thermophilus (strain ATCC BAA-1301 / DSM 18059 / JW/NM-WN-LF) TaxID=457570 RepID=B2A6R3_NATTJ|nr:hypothetical protein [Natranaerobius thermophilus]ACB84196.1 hypothetical protein Nther_0601 [Natranaerobius thermophilus JW/NM-WN-LF]